MPGAAKPVLASGLSFTSLDWEFEDSVGILNKAGGLEGSGTRESLFGSGGRENGDAPVEGATEGFSSDFVSGTVGVGGFAIFFASASAFAFSFSSALRRRRVIASASISCFSHLE